MVVAIMKGYTIFVIILMLLYTARHFYFTIVRLLAGSASITMIFLQTG